MRFSKFLENWLQVFVQGYAMTFKSKRTLGEVNACQLKDRFICRLEPFSPSLWTDVPSCSVLKRREEDLLSNLVPC